ncbi:hypothetical protein ABK040_002845 [Willaertia magna]
MHFIHVEQLLDQEGYTILEKIDSGAYEYNAEDRYSANEILKELKNINLTISNDILNINLCNDHLDNLNDFNNEISYNISYETEIIDKKIIDKKIIDIKIDEEELNEEELGIPAC